MNSSFFGPILNEFVIICPALNEFVWNEYESDPVLMCSQLFCPVWNEFVTIYPVWNEFVIIYPVWNVYESGPVLNVFTTFYPVWNEYKSDSVWNEYESDPVLMDTSLKTKLRLFCVCQIQLEEQTHFR